MASSLLRKPGTRKSGLLNELLLGETWVGTDGPDNHTGTPDDDDLNGVATDCGPDELPYGGTPFRDLRFLENQGA